MPERSVRKEVRQRDQARGPVEAPTWATESALPEWQGGYDAFEPGTERFQSADLTDRMTDGLRFGYNEMVRPMASAQGLAEEGISNAITPGVGMVRRARGPLRAAWGGYQKDTPADIMGMVDEAVQGLPDANREVLEQAHLVVDPRLHEAWNAKAMWTPSDMHAGTGVELLRRFDRGEDLLPPTVSIDPRSATSPEEVLRLLLHETEHGLQDFDQLGNLQQGRSSLGPSQVYQVGPAWAPGIEDSDIYDLRPAEVGARWAEMAPLANRGADLTPDEAQQRAVYALQGMRGRQGPTPIGEEIAIRASQRPVGGAVLDLASHATHGGQKLPDGWWNEPFPGEYMNEATQQQRDRVQGSLQYLGEALGLDFSWWK